MRLKSVVSRALRGFREELRLYVVAVTSLAVAFLCLGGALLAMENLAAIADRFGESGHVTVFLRDGIGEAETARLAAVLEGLREVRDVKVVSSEDARAELFERTDLGPELAELTPDLFPASLEVGLLAGVRVDAIEALAARIGALDGVSDVETYRGWFEHFSSLVAAGRIFALVAAVLVGFCVFAVVGNTIRLSIARRRREIEVMKLCGATHAFVRGPFILEGIVQSLAATLLAILALALVFFAMRAEIDAALSMFLGVKAVFLGPGLLSLLALAAVVIGAASSTLSLRRYLEV